MRDHQYALDVYGKWVNARKSKYCRHSVYFCDCPSKHRMKLVKPSGVLGKRGFCDYFAHIAKKRSRSPVCAHGGESIVHRQAKQVLREMVGKYSFAVFWCTQCECERRVDTAGCSVSIEVRSDDGKWRYDCLLSRDGVPVSVLEVVHTHKTGDEKVQAVRAKGMELAEFRAEDVMILAENEAISIENLQMRIGLCQHCLVEKSLQWMRDCYVDEFDELVFQEQSVFFNYSRMAVLNRVLAVNPEYRRCKRLLRLGMQRRVKLCIPRMGEISCAFTKVWQHGVLASRFSRHLPTHQICIVLLQHNCDLRSVESWYHPSVKRDFHVFLWCSTVLDRLGSLAEETVCLNDCRWAILKGLERSDGCCANCGKYGHTSTECSVKFCIRCGWNGHLHGNCYARTDKFGNSI
jgi:hypothetical protein